MKYEKYKPSGIDWIGDVPQHWDRRKIGRCFQTIGSGTTPEAGKTDYYEEGTINWINTGDLNDGDIFECEKQITQEAFDKHSVLKIYPKGTVLIALYGATIGKTGILQIEGATNQACCALADSIYLIPRFTFYWTNAVKDYLITQSYGGGQPNISQDIIRQLRIYLPNKSEQLTIANYLDHQTQKIDRLIANKKAQAEKFKELRQIEINNAVTKGLNLKAEMKDSGIEWLGKIPKHWEVKRLKNILLNINSGDGISNDEIVENGEIEVYGGNGVMGYTDKFNSEGKVIVIGRVGAKCGIVYLVDKRIWISDNALQSRTLHNYEFVYYLIDAMNLNNYANQNAQPLITGGILKGLYAAIPPKEEQIHIANYLQQRTTVIDELAKNVETQIEQLQELRKIKIYEAVTGKIKVNAYAEATA